MIDSLAPAAREPRSSTARALWVCSGRTPGAGIPRAQSGILIRDEGWRSPLAPDRLSGQQSVTPHPEVRPAREATEPGRRTLGGPRREGRKGVARAGFRQTEPDARGTRTTRGGRRLTGFSERAQGGLTKGSRGLAAGSGRAREGLAAGSGRAVGGLSAGSRRALGGSLGGSPRTHGGAPDDTQPVTVRPGQIAGPGRTPDGPVLSRSGPHTAGMPTTGPDRTGPGPNQARTAAQREHRAPRAPHSPTTAPADRSGR
ncbi:hypothetical protein J2S57_005402 [Kineosporia succinea]|uniref:Uncharacterized protein n=1 Tax=Kineosporia succinea TaxID=84632 RepID=A0ABT9PAG9_9ACTN|nr:hypothetical protein [Kineosporia succinea]